MDETARDDLAQTMMDLGMIEGYALVTPGAGQGPKESHLRALEHLLNDW